MTEAGLGYSWAGNSQMNRLTPWSNDPTSDPPSEVVYLRDEETGDFWTPTPLPLGPTATVTVRHGQGYTRYTHVSRNLDQDLLVFVPTDDPIKLVCLTVRNDGDRPRRLSATYYAEWVLGTVRENAPCKSSVSAIRRAARYWRGMLGPATSPRRSPSWPLVRRRSRSPPIVRSFSGNTARFQCPPPQTRQAVRPRRPALDPGAAATELTLSPGETREVVFALGQADSLEEVHRLIERTTSRPSRCGTDAGATAMGSLPERVARDHAIRAST